jgi:hypothetical protein
VADIEERAAAWVRANFTAEYLERPDFEAALILAYLAGAAQAQRDYAQYYAGKG